jgi:putative ABC transport system permease protein
VLRQFQYMQASNLGFDRERVVVADLRALPNEAVADGHRTLAQRLTRYPEVQAASATQSVPGRSVSEGLLVIPQGKADDETRTLQRYRVAPSYLQTVGIDVVAGRDFRPEDRDASDPTPTVINAEAVRDMGWASPEEALGKTFRRPFGDDPPTFEVVGVVENYHHFSLHETVRPLYMVLEGQAYAYLALRVEAGAEEAALERLRSAWTEVYGGRSLNYFFLDSDFAQQYRSEERLARIFAGFSGLAIFVACLGLFGVAAYTTRQRRKEVTVRKVLGAKTSQLVRLLSAEYAALVGLAFLVAAPVVWVGARRWLQNFAYHTQVEGWALVGAGTIVAVAALLVVGGQALRVAAVDPARTLRQDG